METKETVLAFVEEHRDAMKRSLAETESVPGSMKSEPGLRDAWFAGCWLRHKLLEAGCSEADCERICFAQGQRSLFGDAYRVAASYFNIWYATGRVAEEPGPELGAKIMKETAK